MLYTYEYSRYNFENKIKTDGEYLYCGGYKCKKNKFEKMLYDDYKEAILNRDIDRETTFKEYLETFIVDIWIENDIKLCER